MISKINELKTLTKYISCECKCKFHKRKCNSNQKWNEDKCRSECKDLKEHHVCKLIVIMSSIQQVLLMIQWLGVMKLCKKQKLFYQKQSNKTIPSSFNEIGKLENKRFLYFT